MRRVVGVAVAAILVPLLACATPSDGLEQAHASTSSVQFNPDSAAQRAFSAHPAVDAEHAAALPQPLNPFAGQAKLFGTPGGCNGDIYAVAVAPSGLIYVGGSFSACEDVEAANIAAYNPQTRQFSALRGVERDGTNGPVFSMVVVGADLYVGGNFGVQGSRFIQRWDGSDWQLVGGGTDAIVFALASDGQSVYAAGAFDTAGGQPATRIARWDGNAWSALAAGGEAGISTARTGGLDSAAYALALDGEGLYVGGNFSGAGGIATNYVARWDGSSWSALGAGESNGVDDQVLALTLVPNALIVGGYFDTAGGQSARRVARWDGNSWQPLSGNNGEGVNDDVFALAYLDGDLYVGGQFTQAGTLQASRVARWEGQQWSALGQADVEGVDDTVRAFAFSGGSLVVGGFFTVAGGQQSSHLALWDGSAWQPPGVGAGNGVNGPIYAIAVRGDELYVGGDFSQAGGMTANNIARWNGSQWSALTDGGGNGVDDWVFSLEFDGEQLYVAGFFIQAGGQQANRVARWDGSAWHTLGNGLNNRAYDGVVSNGQYYVGGVFTQAGGQGASHIARWDGSSWHALGSGLNDWVHALAADPQTLYVGGRFTEAGGQPASYLASWDGSTWTAIGSSPENGLNQRVLALAIGPELLYVGGTFFAVAGQPVGYVVGWNGSDFVSLQGQQGAGVGNVVWALQLVDNDLYVGGIFTVAGGVLANGLARWDGSDWFGLSTGLPRQQVYALGTDGTSLFAGGNGLVQTPLPELQSQAIDGQAGNGAAVGARVSRSGNLLVFAATASNLTADDNDQLSDIFVRDRFSGVTRRVSFSPESKGVGDEAFFDPTISFEGSTVAYAGSSGQIYTNAGGLRRTASASASGEVGNGSSGLPMIPDDGSSVVFDTTATNLFGTLDGNGAVADVVRKDLRSGAVQLISQSPAGEAGDGPSVAPWSSADGSAVAFITLASNLSDQLSAVQKAKLGSVAQVLVAHSLGLGRTGTYVSRNLLTGELGNGDSRGVQITPDGRFGVFESLADNLVEGDSNGVSDIFYFELLNRQLVRLERISVSRFGIQANGPSRNPSISDDGQLVSFETDASNLIELDLNQTTDVLLRFIPTGEVLRLSRTVDGNQPNGASGSPQLAGSGRSIVFASLASNLSEGDDNGLSDVFAVQLSDSELAALQAAGPNYSYTYWNPEEPGWGYNLQHQGALLYGTWYTYADDGRVMFLTVEALLQPDGSFAGPVFRVAGTPFAMINGTQAFTAITEVGEASMAFDSDGKLSLSYTVNGVSQTRQLERFVFSADPPQCVGSIDSRAGADNYSDLWWNATEAGWGLTLAHQGEVIFLLWYTYGDGGRDQWVSGSMLQRQPDGTFSGALQRPATGVPLVDISGAATSFPVPEVGSASLRFFNGELGVFTYTLDGVTQSKLIQRFVVVGAQQPKPLCFAPTID